MSDDEEIKVEEESVAPAKTKSEYPRENMTKDEKKAYKKEEKARKKQEAKDEKKRLKEEAKALKIQKKKEAKEAKKQEKLDRKEAKKKGLSYEELVNRKLRMKDLSDQKQAREDEEKKDQDSDGNDDNDAHDANDEDGNTTDDQEDGQKKDHKNKDEEQEESSSDEEGGATTNLLDDSALLNTTPTAPSKIKIKNIDTPKSKSKSKSKSKKNDDDEETNLSTPSRNNKDDLDDSEASKLTTEQKRQGHLFGKKRTIAPSPTRQQKDNEKKLKDPLLSRRRKLIDNHSILIDLNAPKRIRELSIMIRDYEYELKEKPRDPIIEPQHKRAYQERARLEKETPPLHWGKLNSVGGAINFYKINLYLQRLTSLKMFPKKTECPYLGDKRDEYSEDQEWRLIHLNCSVNSISTIKNIDHFIHLRALDLSSNHILTIGNTLETLINLRDLNLANNSIVKIEGLDLMPYLFKLNLHGNQIPKIENLNHGNFQNLKHLDLGGNNLSRVENLTQLPNLTTLDLSRNEIISAEELAFVSQLIELKIGRNKLDNLVEFGRSLVGLSNLKGLKVSGNPICDKRDYRLRVLENTSIQMLDDVQIKPRLRTYLKEMQRRAQIEDIMETTTQDYMDRIEAEREVKSDNMELLRRSQLELEGAFGKYRSEMENELQECISYIHSLDVREDLVERETLLTDAGMKQWKTKLSAAQLRRDVAKRAYVRKQQTALLQQTAHTSEALKYTEKLKELSEARPGIWREMKRRELNQRTVEQQGQLMEDKTIAKDRKNYQLTQQRVREDRERSMLDAVDQIDPNVEAWWDPDAEKRDVTVDHQHHQEAEHRSDVQRRGSSVMDGITKSDNGDSSDAISINSDSTTGSKNSKSSKNSNMKITKKKGTKMTTDDDNNDQESKKKKKTKPKASSAKNRYRVKFGPGSMGIKLVDIPDEDETGVYVKGLVENGKGAQTGKIKVGDILYSIQDENCMHMGIKQALAKIKASTRPIQLEFERPVKIAAHIAASADAVSNIYSTLFEKGKIGIMWEDETREEGGAIVKEVSDNSQAAKHKPPVKSGDVLISVAGEDVTRLNVAAINKRIAKARRPVRFDFESGEGADLLAGAAYDEEEMGEEEGGDVKVSPGKKGKKGGKGNALHAIHKKAKVEKHVKKAKGGFFGWGKKKKSKKVAPEK